MENPETVLKLIDLIVIPVMGWLAVVVKDLNKTLSELNTQSAISTAAQATCAEDRKLLFQKTDELEKDVANIKGQCLATHPHLRV